VVGGRVPAPYLQPDGDPVNELAAPDQERFREVLGRFATGVGVMTTATEEVVHGMTANAFTSVSLDPPLVLVCVDRTAVMADLVQRSGVFAISVLAADQAGSSTAFADPARPLGTDQFDGVATVVGRTGLPLLVDAIAWIEARVWRIHDGGDHLIVVGEVVALGASDVDDPLLYYRSGYARLGPVL
jgi:flavin reductase